MIHCTIAIATRALVLLAILVTNTAFVGDRAPRVVNGPPARGERTLIPVAIGNWHGLRDRDTGTIVWMWGAPIATPGAVADPVIAERAARSFVAAHLGELAPGTRMADLILETDRLDGAIRTIAFRQTWRGMRVVGGTVAVMFSHGRLFAAASEALPSVRTVMPARSRRGPLARTRAWLPQAATLHATGERVIMPIVRGPGAIAYHVADVIEATAPGERWTVYVAPDGEPILRDSRIAHATGTLRFDVGERRPTGPRVLVPAPRVDTVVDGIATTTDDAGVFAWTGGQPASISPTASGPLVTIVDAAGSPVGGTLTAQPGQPVDWSFATDEGGDAQLTAFTYGMIAKARARQIAPALAWLDQQLTITVNEAGSCNAFSTGDDLHFFRAGGECENTGRLADVVLHEFGHSLHAQSIIPGVGSLDLAMSEGLADFFAANLTGDPGVGRGLHFDDTPTRDLDPPGIECTFPEDVVSDTHLTGLILAGALWDLRTALIAELGEPAGIAAVEAIYLGILQRATGLATSYAAALVADDDDGDLDNGTPHLCAIETAFARHGLATGVALTSVGLPEVDGRAVSVTVTPTSGASCPQPTVARIDLEWQVGDGTVDTLPMIASGDRWSATLPPQPAGTVVSYRVVAHLDSNDEIALPDNPADPRYQLFVGPATPIWCDRLDADPQWAQIGTPSWEWSVPLGHADDAPVTFTGDHILGTAIRDSGRYPAEATTGIVTPTIDASAFGRVHLQFRRWLTVDDATHDLATVDVDGAPVWSNVDGVAHVDREWRFVDLELTPGEHAIGWTIASDDDGFERGGWNLDDICVVGLDGPDDCPDCDPPPEAGCCSTSTPGDPRAAMLLGLGALVVVRRRRRRR